MNNKHNRKEKTRPYLKPIWKRDHHRGSALSAQLAPGLFLQINRSSNRPQVGGNGIIANTSLLLMHLCQYCPLVLSLHYTPYTLYPSSSRTLYAFSYCTRALASDYKNCTNRHHRLLL